MSHDDDLLSRQMDAVVETIKAFVARIESGEYPGEYAIYDYESDDFIAGVTVCGGDDVAIDSWRKDSGDDEREVYATLDRSYDELTVGETSIDEYPLEIVAVRGREFAVVLTTGPHIEVVADGWHEARLEGYWGGSRSTRYGDYLSTFLDYFIDRDDTEV